MSNPASAGAGRDGSRLRERLLAALKAVTDDMDRAGGDAYGMSECPWCHREGFEDKTSHNGDCELAMARELIAEVEALAVPDPLASDTGQGEKWTAEQEVEAVKQQLPFGAWKLGASLARCVEDIRMDRDMYRGTLVGLLPVCDADPGPLADKVKRFIGQVIKPSNASSAPLASSSAPQGENKHETTKS